MSLDHEEARGLASQALDEPLDHEREQELALHLVSCAACKMFYDNLQRASDAVRRSVRGTLPPEALDMAVDRATTVLRGEADPGLPHSDPDEGTEPIVVGTIPPDVQGAPEPGTPLPGVPEGPDESEPGAESEPAAEPSPFAPGAERDDLEGAILDVEGEGRDSPVPEEPPTVEPPIPEEPPVEPPETFEPPPPEPPFPHDEAEVVADAVRGAEPAVGAEEVPPPPAAPGEAGLRWRTGPTAVAILATLAVAVLAAFLVLDRTGGPEPAGDAPTVEEVRNGLGATFDDLASLEASYSISRLSLYRVRTEEDRIVYSFSNAEQTGRVAFEAPFRLRQERTLEIPEARAVRSTTVRTPEELRTLVQDGEQETATNVANYPLAPPEGELIPRLGVLEDAVASVSRMIQDSRELEVLGREVTGEGEAGQDEVVRVRFPVSPSPFTRADEIEALLDAETYFPLEIRRTLSREAAEVLGPSEILTADAIDAAYRDLDRITTEHVTVENVQLDEVVLPGEFALDLPAEVQPETRDASFEHDVPRGQVPSMVPFTPLLPTDLPTGYREGSFAALTGEPTAWGPEDVHPAPSGILETVYSDGKTTIVLSQREQPDGPFDVQRSPLAPEGEPVTSRTLVRGGIQLTYAISPELPPHVYGFVGNVFVVVSGYAPQADLLRIASSLETIPDVGADEAETTGTEDE